MRRRSRVTHGKIHFVGNRGCAGALLVGNSSHCSFSLLLLTGGLLFSSRCRRQFGFLHVRLVSGVHIFLAFRYCLSHLIRCFYLVLLFALFLLRSRSVSLLSSSSATGRSGVALDLILYSLRVRCSLALFVFPAQKKIRRISLSHLCLSLSSL